MKEILVLVGMLGLVCRGPIEAPAAQARPTEPASPGAATAVVASAPATAAGAPTGTAASQPTTTSAAGAAATSAPGTLAASLAASSASPAASTGGATTESARRQLPPRLVTAAEDYTAVLLAPVVGSPAAGQVPAGAALTVDAAVLGEVIEGSPDWYFVVHEGEPALRGFVHVSRVRAPE